ncbi:MAG: polyprenyl diphosphate synthase, partial [Terracidiphilus sp.]
MYASGSPRIHELSEEERAVYASLKPESLPQHVAIIMDGNGRWAGRRSLKRFLGHQQGAKSVQLVTETASRIGLPWLTLYAFSLENKLRRPRAEVNFLMRLLKGYLEDNVQRMMDNNVRIRYIGRTHELPPEVQEKMFWAEEKTARNTGTTLTLALNYGARSELVDAFRALAVEMKAKHISPERITEEDLHRHLYTAHMPDPDLLIRTSGEMR